MSETSSSSVKGKFEALVCSNRRIGPGFHREVQRRVGGVKGCTHLVELLRPLATTAFQTLVARRRKAEADPEAQQRRPPFLDTCHAHASDSPEVKRRWPAFYTGPDRAS